MQFILRKTNFRNWSGANSCFLLLLFFRCSWYIYTGVHIQDFFFNTGWLLRWVEINFFFLSICVICCPLVYVVPSTERLYWISQRFCTKMNIPWGGIQRNRTDHSIRNRRGIVLWAQWYNPESLLDVCFHHIWTYSRCFDQLNGIFDRGTRY